MEQLTARILAFAAAVGKTVEEVTEALKQYLGEFNDNTADILADEASTPIEDLKPVLTDDGPKIPLPVLKFNLNLLRGKEKEAEKPATVAAETAQPQMNMFNDVLPEVPEGETLLDALKVGGVQHAGKGVVTCAVSVALANRAGMFGLVDTICKAMEETAEGLKQPVGPEYYDLQDLATKRAHAEIFKAMGIKGEFAGQKQKNELLRRLDEKLWEALIDFNGRLLSWRDQWTAGMANPAMMMNYQVALMSGGAAQLPPGMMQPPDTTQLDDAVESVVEKINEIFAGTAIPTAIALAAEAQNIKKVLDNPNLPRAVGAVNLDQMLTKLGAAVTSDYRRLEKNIVKYALAVMEYPNLTDGQKKINYLCAMLQLGLSIQWEKLPMKNGRDRKKDDFQKF